MAKAAADAPGRQEFPFVTAATTEHGEGEAWVRYASCHELRDWSHGVICRWAMKWVRPAGCSPSV